MREMRNAYKILLENLKGRDHLGDLGVDGDNGNMDLTNFLELNS
jgi:hypothetical protein